MSPPPVAEAPSPTTSTKSPEPTPSTDPPQTEGATKRASENSGKTEYTWQDGDRTITVILDTELAVGEDGPGPKGVYEGSADGAIVRAEDIPRGSKSDPVFRSQSGALMTLPGGVLLVLEPEWSEMQVRMFFATNGIKMDRVEELEYIENGFFIQTDPGFPSLTLANTLAEKEGVLISSPNWWREVTVK